MVRSWIVNAITMGVAARKAFPLLEFDDNRIRDMAAFLDENPDATFEDYREARHGNALAG